MILQLEIKILPKHGFIPSGRLFSCIVLSANESGRNLPRQARRHANQTLAVLLQYLVIYSGLIVETLRESGGTKLHQILISRFVFSQQYQMSIFSGRCGFFSPVSVHYVKFAAQYRLYPRRLRRFVKFYYAVHSAMIRYGQSLHPQLGRPFCDLAHSGRSVQKAVLRMNVQMHKICHFLLPSCGLLHSPTK